MKPCSGMRSLSRRTIKSRTTASASPSQERQTEEAIQQLQEALRLNPGCFEVYINLGVAFEQKGQIDEAIRQYQEALRLKPEYATAHNNLGVVLGRKGRTDEAIRQFQEALRLNPDDPLAP